VVVCYINVLILFDSSALDSSDTHTSNVIVIVDGGNEKLELALVVAFGCGHIFENGVKEGLEVFRESFKDEVVKYNEYKSNSNII
jgi:co-chaperonin GroES (HSP10)